MSYFLCFKNDRKGTPLPLDDLPSETLEKLLDIAVETRRFEIERFWQRSLFFWGFIAAAFVGYAAIAKEAMWAATILMGCFGLVASVAWTLQNRGAKYWQEAWEQKVERIELKLWGTKLFRHTEPLHAAGWFGASRYSVSRLAIMLSDFTVIIWVALIFRLVRWIPDPCHGDWWVASAIVGTVAFCGAMMTVGRSEGGGKQRP
jgi:hypothetical protein